jgi:hypothetical protein
MMEITVNEPLIQTPVLDQLSQALDYLVQSINYYNGHRLSPSQRNIAACMARFCVVPDDSSLIGIQLTEPVTTTSSTPLPPNAQPRISVSGTLQKAHLYQLIYDHIQLTSKISTPHNAMAYECTAFTVFHTNGVVETAPTMISIITADINGRILHSPIIKIELLLLGDNDLKEKILIFTLEHLAAFLKFQCSNSNSSS